MALPLLSIVELGGYPDFTPLYRSLGYQPHSVNSGRRAITTLKQLQPVVVVTEFNFQWEFRDRTSALESILALLQQRLPATKAIIFYHQAEGEALARVQQRFPPFIALPRPITEPLLREQLDPADQ